MRSRATIMVLRGGCFWLKPLAMWVDRLVRAVVVEWPGLKPCWCVVGGKCSVIVGSISFSITLVAGQRSEIGR